MKTPSKPEWKPGDMVEYQPSAGGPWFPATVDSEPWQLGGGTWVVHLKDLPPEYGALCSSPRTTVKAAEATRHVRKRKAVGR